MFYSRARRYGPLIQPILIGQNLWPYKRIPLYSFSELLLDLQKSHHYQKGQPVLEALRSLILHSYLGLDLDRENNVWTQKIIRMMSRLVRILFAIAAVSLSSAAAAELSLFNLHVHSYYSAVDILRLTHCLSTKPPFSPSCDAVAIVDRF